jgi:hypothetical protein
LLSAQTESTLTVKRVFVTFPFRENEKNRSLRAFLPPLVCRSCLSADQARRCKKHTSKKKAKRSRFAEEKEEDEEAKRNRTPPQNGHDDLLPSSFFCECDKVNLKERDKKSESSEKKG